MTVVWGETLHPQSLSFVKSHTNLQIHYCCEIKMASTKIMELQLDQDLGNVPVAFHATYKNF